MATKKLSPNERKKNLIMHLIDNGWFPNVDYIDNQMKRRTGQETFELEALIMGKLDRDFHLISPDEKYTIRIKQSTVYLWRKDPSWKKMFNTYIKQIELIEGGIRWEVLNIILPKESSELDEEGNEG